MSKLRLTIFGVNCYKDVTAVQPTPRQVAVSTDQETDTLYILPSQTGESKRCKYQLNLVDFCFQKKMYQPTEVIAKLQFAMADENAEWCHLGKAETESLFQNKKVALEEVVSNGSNNVIGNDYYVHEVEAEYLPDTMYVTLKIYSPDHLLTLAPGCAAFVAKKLGSQILEEEIVKYKLPYDEREEDNRASVSYSTDNMKVLKYKMSDGKETEHIFPYLVQYNESFYDMLKRTTNRWGEFLFYEDGKLNVGYDDSLGAQELKGWYRMNYCKVNTPLIKGNDIGTYDLQAAYDPNIVYSPLQKSPDLIQNRSFCDLDHGLDVWLMNRIADYLGNTESIPTWIGSQMANEAWDTLEAKKNKTTVDTEFNDQYFKDTPVPEQWGMAKIDGSMKEAHNPFTELNTPYRAEKYSNILLKEQYAGNNAIRLNYDSTNPNLKLGQVIKVYNQEYIVTEVSAKTVVRKTESGETSSVVFLVMGTAKNGILDPSEELDEDGQPIMALTDKNFYPATLPSGHVRTAGPQLATVFDADDPLNQNRVRLHFEWQGIDKENDDEDYQEYAESVASPWLIYATSAASKQNGIFGKHYPGDDVIVNFANGNVEKPYVVGGLSAKGNKVPGSLAERDIVLSSPGGHTLRMEDGSGAGLSAFVAGSILPCYEQLATFFPAAVAGKEFFGEEYLGKVNKDYLGGHLAIKDNLLKRFEGGFQLTDKYGVYSITGSTDGRNVSIKSPWGDVGISAFTGISISAPNGDIEIKGKNVTIEAGNNLELKSGANVEYKMAQKKETPMGTVGTFLYDMGKPVLSVLQEKFQVFDLSFLRNVVEVVMKPVEGALTVKSSRFLKLEAGEGECDYPVSAYKDEATVDELRKEQEKKELRPGLKLSSSVNELVSKVSTVANSINKEYVTLYNKCFNLKNDLYGPNGPIQKGQKWVNGDNRNAAYCKTYDQLTDKLWADGEELLQESDLGFQNYGVESGSDVDGKAVNSYNNSDQGRQDNLENYLLKRNRVIELRKESRAAILKDVNSLRRAIIGFRDMKGLKKMDILNKMGRLEHTPPEGYRDALTEAFNKENLADALYYKAPNTEIKRLSSLWTETTHSSHRLAVKRMASAKLLEELGFKDEWRKKDSNNVVVPRPESEEDFLTDEIWEAYVASIVTVPKLSSSAFNLLKKAKDAVKGALDKENAKGLAELLSGKGENGSWGEAKEGAILFSNGGGTFNLGKTIDKITGAPKENLTVADDTANNDVNTFLTELRSSLNNLQ